MKNIITAGLILLSMSATAQDTLRNETLKELVVMGQQPTAKLRMDKKSYSISQLANNAGLSAQEALEGIPGVTVDSDGQLSLRGNTGVEVWIDGRPSGLTAQNRAEVLQQMAAESIDRIEVIDNPSARYAAEGTAGIINIIMKRDRRKGYYGSAQAGVKTIGAAVGGFNLNYNSAKWDGYLSIGYRHRRNKGKSESDQTFKQSTSRQWYRGNDTNTGNSLYNRAGITLHATPHDEFSAAGTLMVARRKNHGHTGYGYDSGTNELWIMERTTRATDDMKMYYGELSYRHTFADKHFVELVADVNRWTSDNNDTYQDSTLFQNPLLPTAYAYQRQAIRLSNRTWEVRADYENPLSEQLLLRTGYLGRFSHEDTPQHTYADENNWNGDDAHEVGRLADHFVYDLSQHNLYATLTFKRGQLTAEGGLRGEYWHVDTSQPFNHNYLQLFPSLIVTWQLAGDDQLQVSLTRRLRRPYGSQLNSFHDTHDATTVIYGNPRLTPEYANSLQLSYLKPWRDHSMLVVVYYRPTSNAIQPVSWHNEADGLFHATYANVPHSHSEGVELSLKNRLFSRLDLTNTLNAYAQHIDAFGHTDEGKTVAIGGNSRFTWNIRTMVSLALPHDIAVQATAYYHAREAIAQGYRLPVGMLDVGLRKHFMQKRLTLAINSHDIFSTRKLEKTRTETDSYVRRQLSNRGSRKVNFTLTWNFGNAKTKRKMGKVEDPTDAYKGETDD